MKQHLCDEFNQSEKMSVRREHQTVHLGWSRNVETDFYAGGTVQSSLLV